MTYLTFLIREKRLLSFGFSYTFVSSFGQTFLISLFVPYFLNDFQLSKAGFGSLYSAATLSSAALLPYLGQWIDHLPIKRYSLYVLLGLLTASIIMSLSWHVGLLFMGLAMLRLTGQGLSSHTAQTTMARYFDSERGKALSISSLGYPIGEGILPIIVAGLLTILSWRTTWVMFSLVLALFFIPLVLTLLNGSSKVKNGETTRKRKKNATLEDYKEIMSEGRFWLLVPAVLLPAFWATALFLYQVFIANQLGWSATLIASAFVAFAITRILSSLGVGPFIDYWTAKKLFPFYLIPFTAGLLVAWFHPGSWSAFLYMGLLGVTMGMGSNIKSALWAELYGTETIGTVRSLFSALMVFSTALSPFLIGWLMDYNVSITSILSGAIASFAIATILAFFAFQN